MQKQLLRHTYRARVAFGENQARPGQITLKLALIRIIYSSFSMGLGLVSLMIVLVKPRIKLNSGGIVVYLQGSGNSPEHLCLGPFWQPAAHRRHTLFGIEKQPKFTWWNNASERTGR